MDCHVCDVDSPVDVDWSVCAPEDAMEVARAVDTAAAQTSMAMEVTTNASRDVAEVAVYDPSVGSGSSWAESFFVFLPARDFANGR